MHKLIIAIALVGALASTTVATEDEQRAVIAFASLLMAQKAVCAPLDQSPNAAALLQAAKSAGVDLEDANVNRLVKAATVTTTQLANQLISQKRMPKREWCRNIQASLDNARESTLSPIASSRR
jgi:hypothetical protein